MKLQSEPAVHGAREARPAVRARREPRICRFFAVALSAMSLESAPQVEFDLHPDERIEIDDDDDVLRRELGI